MRTSTGSLGTHRVLSRKKCQCSTMRRERRATISKTAKRYAR